MKICIFGAASAHIDQKYIDRVETLGEELARNGHSLVFGCGGTGLMGAAARGFKRANGYVHGVVPSFFRDEGVEELFSQCDKVTYTETMSVRKKLMEDEADAFIVVPGGIGTFEEFFEVLTLKQLGRHEKAIVIYNIDGYYNNLEKFMQEVTERKFITFACHELYSYFNNPGDVLEYLQSYKPSGTSWRNRKIGD